MWLDREHYLGHLVASVLARAGIRERCLGVCVASLDSELRDPALMKY